MRTSLSPGSRKSVVLFLLWVATASLATPVQLISVPEPAHPAPPGGDGDSLNPLLTPDGRYVLFASTAHNLLLLSNAAAIPPVFPPVLNVFLRDRTNGTTALVSINFSGVGGGNGDSQPYAVSTNGRFALFESSASDLVPGDTNNATDVLVRDLVGASTALVSVNTNGVPGNGASRNPAMTPDGRYVAFVSAASDLVPDDTNGVPDVFLRDLQAGETMLVSVGAQSRITGYPSGGSEAPVITPDGRYVAFQSTATNLVPGVPATRDIYVRDLVTSNTLWISAGSRLPLFATFHTSDAICYNQQITADAQFIAYEASPNVSGPLTSGIILRYCLATGLTDAVDTNACGVNSAYQDFQSLDMTPDGRFIAYIANTNGIPGATTCVRLWDANTGTSIVVSGDLSNSVPAYSTCHWPAIDPTGQFVTFLSTATNLTTNTLVGDYHIYRRDISAAATTLLDADADGIGSPLGAASVPQFSGDGRLVAFDCPDANLVPGDRNRVTDVFVRDLVIGGSELISTHDPALPCATPNGSSLLTMTSVSRDGRYVAFASDADDLVPADTNGCRDVFVRDLVAGTNLLISVGTNGSGGDGISTGPAISGDGRYVAFTSLADNLVAGDTNRAQDVFVRDLQAAVTTLISVKRTGTGSGNASSYCPMLGSTGRYLVFRSLATDLATGYFTGESLFWRDLLTVSNYALTTAGVVSASMTPDGRYTAFTDKPAASAGQFYIWDSQAVACISTNSTPPGLTTVAISPDGRRVACWTGSGGWLLSLFDRAANTNWTIATGLFPGPHPTLRFSASGDRLAYTAGVSNSTQVFLYDFPAGTNLLVSTNFGPGAWTSGVADSADISADGRFIAYRSAAQNLVPGDTNGWPQVFLFDSQTGANTLLSMGLSGAVGANYRCLAPVFSGDSRTLFFASVASDLTVGDFNNSSDLFAFTLFYATILPVSTGGEGLVLSWPWIPGANYRIEYKENLPGGLWRDLGGTVTHVGNKGYLQDSVPNANQRFYRIVSF